MTGRSPSSSFETCKTLFCSSKLHEATSDACAFTVMAEIPWTAATSRRCPRYEASSIDRSSWNGSRTAGMTPAGRYIRDILIAADAKTPDRVGRNRDHRDREVGKDRRRDLRREVVQRRHEERKAGIARGAGHGDGGAHLRRRTAEEMAGCERGNGDEHDRRRHLQARGDD